MEVILKEDVKHLGSKNELVKVRPGYARNFLIPKGLAVEATDSKKKEHMEMIKQRAHKEEKILKEAQKAADVLKNITLKVGAKVGEKGKIFGSITPIQIADAIKKIGYEVNRKDIIIENQENIKSLGTYSAVVKLHKDVSVTVTFEVIAE
jgi:large subunit ribosomal protein L9